MPELGWFRGIGGNNKEGIKLFERLIRDWRKI